MKFSRGFTLIELMIVIAIIGMLSVMAMPTYHNYVIRTQISEALELGQSAKSMIVEYYSQQQQFPAHNAAAQLPEPKQFIGNYVKSVEIEQGAIHVYLGNRINTLVADKVLSLRPAYVEGSPLTPIAWLCGQAEPVDGMKAQGENKTTIPPAYLPPSCRSWKAS